jgi:regulator of cell morphogenesis and NO signaling
METEALIAYILARYHATHRRELQELSALAHKVETVHADDPAAPRGLSQELSRMIGELEAHMTKEELILFPAMQRASNRLLDAPISVMREDHDGHDEAIERIESLMDGFIPPVHACGSWRRLCLGVAKLCDDLRAHIRLENDILFPRFETGQ